MKRLLVPVLLAAVAGAGVAVAAVVLAGGAGRSTSTTASTPVARAQSSSSATRRDISSTGLTATQIYQRDSSGVVLIKAVTSDGEDLGTGIVLNEEGLILTNDHVIEGAVSLTVSPGTSPSTARTASVVGEEANSDLALIRVSPSGLGLKPLKLVSSSSVQVGDPVYAIGNPYGLDETLTRGIVSALNREISAPDGAKITGALQTDAALNPGNSGGPLLDEEGEVIGVNSQIASDAASSAGSQPGSTGVGFAIASNTVAEAIKKIEAGNGVTYASATQSQTQSEGGYATRSPYGARSPYEAQGSTGEGEATIERGAGVQREGETGGERETGGEGSEVIVR